MSLFRRRRAVDAADDSDFATLASPGALDLEWYRVLVGQPLSLDEAVAHYLDSGRHQGLTPHPLVDAEHLMRGISFVPAGRDSVAHYYRNPRLWTVPSHPLFATAAWIAEHPESLTHPGGPAEHYVRTGLPGGQMPSAAWPASDDVVGQLAAWTRGFAGIDGQTEPPRPVGTHPVILIRCTGHLPRLTRLLGSLADSHDEARVFLSTAGLNRSSAFTVALMGRSNTWLTVVPDPPGGDIASAWGLLAAELESQAPIVVLDSEVEVIPGWLRPLVEEVAAAPEGAIATTSVVLDGEGVMRAAGLSWSSADSGWLPLLEGFAGQELPPGGVSTVPASTDAVVAVRRADLPFDLVAPSLISHRITEAGGRVVVCHDSFVVQPESRDFELASSRSAPNGDEHVHVISRGPEAALRWAIKCPAPFGRAGETWGDLHFARELAGALRDRGHHVVIDSAGAFDRPTRELDDVALLLRGLRTWTPGGDGTSILWAISHPDDISEEEAAQFDVVAAASGPWAASTAHRWHVPVHTLLQATDARLFHPDCATPDSGPEVLFIGVNKGGGRPLVEWAVEAGLPLRVYGPGWGSLPEGMWCGERAPRAGVPALYRSAGLVLCEHAEEMASAGFVQNRVLDVLAAGGRAVSNPVEGMSAVVPGVAVVTGPDDLRALFDGDRRAQFGDDAAVRERAAVVAREHSFAARARELENLVVAAPAL